MNTYYNYHRQPNKQIYNYYKFVCWLSVIVCTIIVVRYLIVSG